MINGRKSSDGALFVLQQAAPADAVRKGGQAMTELGALYVGNVGVGSYSTPNGYLTDQNGTLMVGPPPIVGYKGGYPYNADGELVVQLNQPPVPGDEFVGGIRVGPLGGIYVIDTTPPPPPDAGFSDGYSNGYDAVPPE